MSRISIYIDGKPVDLYPGTFVASSFQLGDFSDLRSRNASHTNQFKLPKTGNNNRIFGHADNIKSNTNKPYIKLPARVMQNGQEIIPEGTAFISLINEAYNVSIYSDNFEFFDAIKGSLISEIDFGESLKEWDAATREALVVASGSPTSALSCAVIQYGQLDLTDATFLADVTTTLPSVLYCKIIEKIITNAGYTFEGSVFDDEKFKSLALPFSRDRFEFGGAFHRNREFKARMTQPFTLTTGPATITYDIVDLQDDYGLFDATTGVYDCNVAFTSHGDMRPFNFGLFAEVTFTVHSGTYEIDLNEAGNVGFPSISSEQYTAGTYTVAIGYDDPTENTLIAEADANYRIDIGAVVVGSCTVHSALFYNKSYGDNFLTEPQFFVEEILPDIEQTDMMRDFAIRFGVMFKERNKVLTCKRFSEIAADRANAKDWTTKRDTAFTSELSFDFSQYAQRNLFTYPSTDEVYKEGSGDGALIVTNENIETENEYHNSIFNGTATQQFTNAGPETIYCANIPVWETEPADIFTPFDNAPGLRLLLLRDKYSTEPNIVFDGASHSTFKIGYFIDPSSAFQCDWQQAITENYSEMEESLSRAKVVTNYYRLNDLDIAGLDLLQMIHDNGDYFIINKIDNYKPGYSTKVQLLKIWKPAE